MVSVGSIVAGRVAKVMNYGAFVDLEGGGSGMIHISEVANTYVKDINDYLKVGDEVTVKVIAINEGGKISLSMRALEEADAPAEEVFDYKESGQATTGLGALLKGIKLS